MATERRRSLIAHLLIALVTYVPLLLTKRGQVVADTKQYLTLDPGEMLRASTSLWDPDWALGTVTHQSIGYLWPMAPWMRVGELVGLPVWFTQRLWLASILFAAAAGVLFLGRVLGWSVGASTAAGLFYALSPYPLAYATRMSALIMPWAGLPWLLGFAILALRQSSRPGRWRNPARLALVATTIGAINASSLIYVGIAVIAWFPFAVWGAREASVGQAIATMLRIGLCLIGASLWWAVALVVQSQWGPDVLRFSETLEVVASGSPSTEAWRGLGYWVFYGGDRTGAWVSAGEPYTQSVPLLMATFALSLVSLVALFVVQWRYRVYMLGLAIGGLLLTTGLFPYDDPSPIGAVVTDSAASSTLALALRSSPRAIPLFLIAVASSFAIGIDALRKTQQRYAHIALATIVALTGASIPVLWTGDYVGAELARDEQLPQPWTDAAAWLDQGDPNERVLLLPGGDFSAFRWGNTIDHPLPGITTRPVAVRELIPYGSAASADLLIALDRRAQERLLEPAQIAPITSLLGVGDIVVQSDLEFERYRTPRPEDFWQLMTSEAAALSEPVAFGPPSPDATSTEFPMLDSVRYSIGELPLPPQVAAISVPDARGIIRTSPTAVPLLVAGDAESLLEIAGAGLLQPNQVVLFEASLTDDQLQQAVADGAVVILTDGNRVRARRWKTIRDNLGLTESTSGDGLDSDPTDARLDVFPEADAGAYTWTEQTGVLARSSAYGNPVSYHSEDRAAHAVDGDHTTAWRVGAFTDARGQTLSLEWPSTQTASTLRVTQPSTLDPNRTITELSITLDDAEPFVVALDASSLSPDGQPVQLPSGGFSRVTLEVVETSAGDRPGYGGQSSVGFSEVWLDDSFGASAEVLVTPTSLSERLSDLDSDANPFHIVLARERVSPSSLRDDPETNIARQVTIPHDLDLMIGGFARVSGRADDFTTDATLRRLGGQAEIVFPRVTASTRLPGEAENRAGVAIDGDPTTVFRPDRKPQTETELAIELGQTVDLASLTFDFLINEIHSRPTQVELVGDNGEARVVALDDLTLGNGLYSQVVDFEPLTTSTLTVRFIGVEPVRSTEWYSANVVEQPIGVAEITIPGIDQTPFATSVVDECRDDLLTIDGKQVSVRISGDLGAATKGEPLIVEGCEPLTLAAGTHHIVTASRGLGLSIDRLVLSSSQAAPLAEAAPAVAVTERARGSYEIIVSGAQDDFWLVLGESYSAGWTAQVDGGDDLGEPVLIDGFANGWRITNPTGEQITVTLQWGPNRMVRLGLWLSLAAVLACLWLALKPQKAHPEDRRAVLGWINIEPGPAVGTMPTVIAALSAGVGYGLLTRPWIGLLTSCLVLVGLLTKHGRRVVAFCGVAALGAAAAYVVILQTRYDGPHDGAWPSLWDRAHLLGLVAIGALVAEWTLSWLSQRQTGRTQ